MEIDKKDLIELLEYLKLGLHKIVDRCQEERTHIATYDAGLMHQAIHFFYMEHVQEDCDDEEDDEDE